MDDLTQLIKDLTELTSKILEEAKNRNPQKIAHMVYLMYKKERGFLSSFTDPSIMGKKRSKEMAEMTTKAFDLVSEKVVELIKEVGWEEEYINEYKDTINELMKESRNV